MKLSSHIRIWSVAWLLMLALSAFGAPRTTAHSEGFRASGLGQVISSALSILERSGEPQVTVSFAAPHSFTRQSAFSPMLSAGGSRASFYSSYYRYICDITSLSLQTDGQPPRYLELRRLLI